MHKSVRPIAATVIAGALAVGVSACGSSSTGTSPAQSKAPASTSTKPILGPLTLTGVQTSVTLDSNLLPTLTKLMVTPKPTGKATLTMPGGAATLNFPISGGNVTIYKKGAVTPYVQGLIHHEGAGLSLTAGGKTLTVDNFDINPGTSVLTAEVVQMNNARIPLFTLDGSDLVVTPPGSDGIAKLDGTKVTFTAAAADAINKYFGVTAFTPQIPIGIAHIQAKG